MFIYGFLAVLPKIIVSYVVGLGIEFVVAQWEKEVKAYVADLIGKQYVIPTLGVYTKAEDIDWGALPEQFVLKCNHDGGSNSVVLCKNKAKMDRHLEEVAERYQEILKEWHGKKIYREAVPQSYLSNTEKALLKD
jgi:hypothetical protein